MTRFLWVLTIGTSLFLAGGAIAGPGSTTSTVPGTTTPTSTVPGTTTTTSTVPGTTTTTSTVPGTTTTTSTVPGTTTTTTSTTSTTVPAGGKVTICHKGNTIEVADDAVPAHLAHGDSLG